jgi:hypothetical protein
MFHRSAREEFEHFDLVGGDPKQGVTDVRIDLGIVPLPPEQAGGGNLS